MMEYYKENSDIIFQSNKEQKYMFNSTGIFFIGNICWINFFFCSL